MRVMFDTQLQGKQEAERGTNAVETDDEEMTTSTWDAPNHLPHIVLLYCCISLYSVCTDILKCIKIPSIHSACCTH